MALFCQTRHVREAETPGRHSIRQECWEAECDVWWLGELRLGVECDELVHWLGRAAAVGRLWACWAMVFRVSCGCGRRGRAVYLLLPCGRGHRLKRLLGYRCGCVRLSVWLC